MGWKQCTTPFPGDCDGIQKPFEAVFEALHAPPSVALFCRTTHDFQHEIFLLTPDAARHFSAFPGEWIDADDPTAHGWRLLVGHADAFENFGLRTTDIRREC
jgi:hypothetical protein